MTAHENKLSSGGFGVTPMKRIREVIVVEGRYDKNALSQVVDAVIIETSGFAIFRDSEKRKLLRRMAQERGIVIFTDSDSAGFLIRNHLVGGLPTEQVKHAYIPDKMGKERRKSAPSKEGKIGVEGMPPEVLLAALERAGATFDDEPVARRDSITKADLYAAGLSGGAESAARRARLLQTLDLPEHLTANALLAVINALYTKEGFELLLSAL